MTWNIEFLKEAEKDLNDLDGSVKKQVLKGIQKVSQNPLPDFQGGYGKPLGNLGGTNLSGLMKIKFRKDRNTGGLQGRNSRKCNENYHYFRPQR